MKFGKIYQLLARARASTTSPARFVARVAFARGRPRSRSKSRGIVEGEIAPEPTGSHGFGYDPIFFYPPLGCTLAEVDGDAKAQVSHRGAAFREFRDYLLAHTPGV